MQGIQGQVPSMLTQTPHPNELQKQAMDHEDEDYAKELENKVIEIRKRAKSTSQASTNDPDFYKQQFLEIEKLLERKQ